MCAAAAALCARGRLRMAWVGPCNGRGAPLLRVRIGGRCHMAVSAISTKHNTSQRCCATLGHGLQIRSHRRNRNVRHGGTDAGLFQEVDAAHARSTTAQQAGRPIALGLCRNPSLACPSCWADQDCVWRCGCALVSGTPCRWTFRGKRCELRLPKRPQCSRTSTGSEEHDDCFAALITLRRLLRG